VRDTVVSYQLQKAMKNPNHEKKNTLPYWLMGFSIGMDLAFLLMGLMTGAVQSTDGENMVNCYVQVTQIRRSCQQVQLASSRFIATLYSHTLSPVILGDMPRSKVTAHNVAVDTEKRMQNATSQVVWAFAVMIKLPSNLNIQIAKLSRIGAQRVWLRNYHLEVMCTPSRANVFVLLRGAGA
jgi:hypothetical protein